VLVVASMEVILKFLAAHRICPPLRLSIWSVTVSSLREVVVFGGKTFMGGIARITLYQGNSLLIGIFLGPASLAVFARALALVNCADQVLFQFARVLVPMASSAEARKDPHSLSQVVLVGSRYSNLLALPIVIGLVILGPAMMRVWMGPQYAILPVLSILAAGHLAAMAQVGPLSILQGINRHGTPALAALGAGVLSIAVSGVLLGVFHMDLIAVSLSIGISLTLVAILVTPHLVARAIGLPVLTYCVRTLSSAWLVIPFALWVGACRVLLSEHGLLQILCGAGGGGVILLLSYWKTMMPDSIKARILGVFSSGKRT
jgi:O-antigen/teichoic acid export membrane protein